METQSEAKPEPFLSQMSLRRGGKKPYFINVRLYSTSDIDDPRPFIARDLKGNEIELRLSEQVMAETIVLRKPRAETLDRLRAENNSLKRR